MTKLQQTKANRITSIDQFRGFAIIAMALANFMGGISLIPGWLKHAPDIGLTVIDFIAPFFIFAISLTYGFSFRRRLEHNGSFLTYSQFFTRYLAIIGLGTLISTAETAINLNNSKIEWGVLQAIGVAGLLTLVVIRLRPALRFVIGLSTLALYQLVLDRFLLDLTLRSPHGGLFGSFSWGTMMILGTTLADLFHGPGRGRKLFPLASLAVLLAGIGLALLSPVSKHRVSSSYVLISLGVSALLFWVFQILSSRFQWQGRFLVAWGMNPLMLYFLHYLIIGFFVIPGIPFLYAEAPFWLILLEIAILIGGISVVAYWLSRHKWYISL